LKTRKEIRDFYPHSLLPSVHQEATEQVRLRSLCWLLFKRSNVRSPPNVELSNVEGGVTKGRNRARRSLAPPGNGKREGGGDVERDRPGCGGSTPPSCRVRVAKHGRDAAVSQTQLSRM